MGTFYGPNGPETTNKPYDVVKVVPQGHVLFNTNDPSFAYFGGQNVPLKNGIIVNYQDSVWQLVSEEEYRNRFALTLEKARENLILKQLEKFYEKEEKSLPNQEFVEEVKERILSYIKKEILKQQENNKEQQEERPLVSADYIFQEEEDIEVAYLQVLAYFLNKAAILKGKRIGEVITNSSEEEKQEIIDAAANLFIKNTGVEIKDPLQLLRIKTNLNLVLSFHVYERIKNPTNFKLFDELFEQIRIDFSGVEHVSAESLMYDDKFFEIFGNSIYFDGAYVKVVPTLAKIIALSNYDYSNGLIYELSEDEEIQYLLKFVYNSLQKYKENGFFGFREFLKSKIIDNAYLEEGKRELLYVLLSQFFEDLFEKNKNKFVSYESYAFYIDDLLDIASNLSEQEFLDYLQLSYEKILREYEKYKGQAKKILVPAILLKKTKLHKTLIPKHVPYKKKKERTVEELDLFFNHLLQLKNNEGDFLGQDRILFRTLSTDYVLPVIASKSFFKNSGLFRGPEGSWLRDKINLIVAKASLSEEEQFLHELAPFVEVALDGKDTVFSERFKNLLQLNLFGKDQKTSFFFLQELFNLYEDEDYRDYGYLLANELAKRESIYEDLAGLIYSSKLSLVRTGLNFYKLFKEAKKPLSEHSRLNIVKEFLELLPQLKKASQELGNQNLSDTINNFLKLIEQDEFDFEELLFSFVKLYHEIKKQKVSKGAISENYYFIKTANRMFSLYHGLIFSSVLNTYNEATKNQVATLLYKFLKDFNLFFKDERLAIPLEIFDFSYEGRVYFSVEEDAKTGEINLKTGYQTNSSPFVILSHDEFLDAFLSSQSPLENKNVARLSSFVNMLYAKSNLRSFSPNKKKNEFVYKDNEDTFDKIYEEQNIDEVHVLDEDTLLVKIGEKDYLIHGFSIVPSFIRHSESGALKEYVSSILKRFSDKVIAIEDDESLPLYGNYYNKSIATLSPFELYHISKKIGRYVKKLNPRLYELKKVLFKKVPVFLDMATIRGSYFKPDGEIIVSLDPILSTKEFEDLEEIKPNKEYLEEEADQMDFVRYVSEHPDKNVRLYGFLRTLFHEFGHLLHSVASGETKLTAKESERLAIFKELSYKQMKEMKERYKEDAKGVAEALRLERIAGEVDREEEFLLERIEKSLEMQAEEAKELNYAEYQEILHRISDISKEKASSVVRKLSRILASYGYKSIYQIVNFTEIFSTFLEAMVFNDREALERQRLVYEKYMRPVFEVLKIPNPYEKGEDDE